ncbi:MAG: Endoglucanase precursor [Actinobacteria bacterium ADurb.Bin444]|nr:MAG: Endoglucanase precursor [Actinobacteria bacterium ADurb.Bin444]
MWATGIIVGYEIGGNLSEFRPSESVLRAQFAKMLAGAVDLRAEENMISPFTDLGPDDPTSLYPHQYVAVAHANGIVAGLTPTTFGPWLNVARAQIISMMVRAASTLFPGALTEPPTVWSGSLGDFSPTHGANTRIAEYNGLLQGLTGFGPSWDPWGNASRGEVAQMLWNLMQRLQMK